MKPRIVGVLAVLAVAILASPTLSRAQAQAPTLADLVSESTLIYVSVNMSPSGEQGQALAALVHGYLEEPGLAEAWSLMSSRMRGSGEMGELQEWLSLLNGESAVALASFTSNEPIAVAALGTDRPQDLLAKIGESARERIRPLDGTEGLLEIPGRTTTYLVPTERQVLISNSREELEAALAHYRAGALRSPGTLAADANYQRVMGRLPAERVASVYYDMGSFMGAMSDMAAMAGGPGVMVTPDFSELQGALGELASGRVGVAAMARNDGIMLISEMEQAAGFSQKASPGRILSAIPGNALLAVTTYDIKSMVDQLLPTVETFAAMGGVTGEQIKGMTGIDLYEDLVSWMDGEFGIALVPDATPNPFGPEPPELPSLLVSWGIKDRVLVQAKIEKLLVLASLAGAAPASTSVQGIEMSMLPLMGDLALYYGFAGDWLLVVLGEPTGAVDSALGRGGLAGNPRFARAISALPSPNTGVMYLDVAALRGMVESWIPESEREQYDTMVGPFLRPLQLVAASSTPTEGGRTRSVLWLGIGPD